MILTFQISFNGASCPETFIGDYSFQEPRKEQVTSSILEERIYWILSLFYGSRNGVLPETVIITRDGVSEGQFKMVSLFEFFRLLLDIVFHIMSFDSLNLYLRLWKMKSKPFVKECVVSEKRKLGRIITHRI